MEPDPVVQSRIRFGFVIGFQITGLADFPIGHSALGGCPATPILNPGAAH